MKKLNLLWMTGILILFVNASFAQQKIITGVVKSAVDHNPLSGVTVTIKELNKSVVTEEDGSFKVTVTGDKAKSIEFTSMGFEFTKQNIDPNNVMTIKLF